MDCYFEEGEVGYEDCFRDVPDRPATELEPNPPTHSKLVPFRSVSLSLPINATKDDVIAEVRIKLEAFKRAHGKVSQVSQFVGLEIKV